MAASWAKRLVQGQARGPVGEQWCRWRGACTGFLHGLTSCAGRVGGGGGWTLGLLGSGMPITCEDETVMIFIELWSSCP